MSAMVMYGVLLIAPIIHEFLSQVPAAAHSGPTSAMPKACGNDKFAPLLPVWSHPCMAALIEFKMIVKYSALGCLHLCAFSVCNWCRSSSSNSSILSKSSGFWATSTPLRRYGNASSRSCSCVYRSTLSWSSSLGIPVSGFLILDWGQYLAC